MINLEKSAYSRLAPEDKSELERGYIAGLLATIDDELVDNDGNCLSYDSPIIDRRKLTAYLQDVFAKMDKNGLTLDDATEATDILTYGEYIALTAKYGQEMTINAPFTPAVKSFLNSLYGMRHPALYLENGQLIAE